MLLSSLAYLTRRKRRNERNVELSWHENGVEEQIVTAFQHVPEAMQEMLTALSGEIDMVIQV